MDRGGWWATVHGVAGSRTRLCNFTSLHSLCSVDPTVVRPKAKIVIQAQILEL